jgi:hypothetical protein
MTNTLQPKSDIHNFIPIDYQRFIQPACPLTANEVRQIVREELALFYEKVTIGSLLRQLTKQFDDALQKARKGIY